MSTSERSYGVACYVLSIVVSVPLLLSRVERPFAKFHALQAIGIFLAGVAGLLAWLILGWILSLGVPLVGPAVATGLFALVIALAIALFVCSVYGIANALSGRRKPVPLVGEGVIHLYLRLARPDRGTDQPTGDDG